MTVAQLHEWFYVHMQNPNYQHRGMTLEQLDLNAEKSFLRLTPAQQNRVMEVCRAYNVVIDGQPDTLRDMLRFRYLAQTNLFALCHLLEKYTDMTDKTYVWTDGVIHNTHEEIANEFFVKKDPTKKTFKQFATEYEIGRAHV